MYCELLSFQENVVLYLNPNVSQLQIYINNKNKLNNYFIFHEQSFSNTYRKNSKLNFTNLSKNDNVKFIKLKDKIWEKLLSKTLNNTWVENITEKFIENINHANYTKMIRSHYQYLIEFKHNAYKTSLEFNHDKLQTTDDDFTELFNNIAEICKQINFDYDYKKYFNIYKLKIFNNINDIKIESFNLIKLNDIIYENKTFYDNNKNEIANQKLLNDYEIANFKSRDYAKKLVTTFVTNDVFYIDYTFDHYNFGEFIDVLKRLLYVKKSDLEKYHISKTDLLSLKRTDVIDINYYFKQFNFIENNKNIIDWANINQQIILPNNTYINTCSANFDIYRNYISKTTSFLMNEYFNKHDIQHDLKYKLFLSRDGTKRESVNKKYFYDELLKRNFIFLNGSESLDTIQKYFTNASIIVGEHGSLFQNVYFCKSNPFIIELSPVKFGDHMIFLLNSLNLGLNHLLFFLEAINLENEVEGRRGPLHLKYNDETVNNILTIVDNIKIIK